MYGVRQLDAPAKGGLRRKYPQKGDQSTQSKRVSFSFSLACSRSFGSRKRSTQDKGGYERIPNTGSRSAGYLHVGSYVGYKHIVLKRTSHVAKATTGPRLFTGCQETGFHATVQSLGPGVYIPTDRSYTVWAYATGSVASRRIGMDAPPLGTILSV